MSKVRNSVPTVMEPSGANSIPAVEVRIEAGMAAINVSTPNVIQGFGRIACRQRTIPDFPALEPPFKTITWVGVRGVFSGVIPEVYRVPDLDSHGQPEVLSTRGSVSPRFCQPEVQPDGNGPVSRRSSV